MSESSSIACAKHQSKQAQINILILNTDLPVFPGGMGCEYLHTTHLAALADNLGLVSMAHSREHLRMKGVLSQKGVRTFLWESPWIDSPPSETRLPSLGTRIITALYHFLLAAFARPIDTVVRDFQFRNMGWPLLSALIERKWDAIVVIQSSCGRWFNLLPQGPVKILVLHDVRALVYERKARSANSIAQKIAAWYEAMQYRRLEKKFCSDYDLVITVSSTDERWVREHYDPPALVTVPLPVDRDYFSPMSSIRCEKARIVFTGMMNHPPNEDAVFYFATRVFPLVRGVVPDAEFWIVGRDPTEKVRGLERLQNVKVTGFVLDIREHLASATVVVVPLRFGAGMRNKILEAWGMEKAVVSTTVGAEGLDCRHGENIFIEDDPRKMANQIARLIGDDELRSSIGRAGRSVIAGNHDPVKLASAYYEAIASVVKAKKAKRRHVKAVIDLRWMRPGFAGGIEDLSRSFLKELLELDRINRYKVLVPAEVRYDFDLRSHDNIQIVSVDGLLTHWRRVVMRGAAFTARKLGLDYRRNNETEILRKLHNLDSEIALSVPGYISFDLYPLLNVLIVPDIQHEYFPEFFTPQVCAERKRLYTDSIMRAQHICAISEYTKYTLMERFGIPGDRITTTHLAADPIFQPGSPFRKDGSEVLRGYGLKKGSYLFFPAKTWPHKNHMTAIRAISLLRDSYGLDMPLVCTGGEREAHNELIKAINEMSLGPWVKFLGYCPKEHLPAIYEGAGAVVFPSLFEGFGMPVLEAMWCGCPVVCSNTTSLPEIVGDAAILVDPLNAEAMADGIYRVLSDDGLRLDLIAKGLRQAEKFSWRRFTLQVVRIMNQVMENN
jgi:glycosyltransferase involved in cell wall biosynthesis